jgi:predicted PurR-regulated permease PerM
MSPPPSYAHTPISRFLVVAAAFVIVVAGMKSAATLLVPFFLALFMAIISTPPLVWMKGKGLPTWLALIIILTSMLVIAIGLGTIIGSSIASFRTDLPEYQLKLTNFTASLFTKLSNLGFEVDFQQVKESFDPSVALTMAGATLASFGNLMSNFLLILMIVAFILVEEVSLTKKLRYGRNSNQSLEAIGKFTESVNHYLAIKFVMSLLTGVFILVWLWIQGVDYFVLWGLIAFLLNFVPTIGSVIAAIPAVLLALIQLGVPDAIITAVGFLIANFAIGNVIEPKIMGRGLGLSALVVILSLIFWGWVLGPVGMLLSIPLTMTVKIALENFEETKWIAIVLGSGKELEEANH